MQHARQFRWLENSLAYTRLYQKRNVIIAVMLNFFRRESQLSMRNLEHPQLGSISYMEEGWWVGHRIVNGYAIEFNLDGTEDGPDLALVKDLEFVLTNFSSIWQEGKRFIEQETRKSGPKKLAGFTPNTICNFLRKGSTSYFMMYLSLEGDEYGLWKLEFYDGKAKYLSCDT